MRCHQLVDDSQFYCSSFQVQLLLLFVLYKEAADIKFSNVPKFSDRVDKRKETEFKSRKKECV